jgi:hypothetical protein
MLFYPDDHADGGDCRRYADAAVVRPHLCPERAWATCGAAFGDGNGEPSLQNTAGSVHPALDTKRTTSRVGTDPMTPMPYGL